LINFGILPLTFENPIDMEGVRQGDRLRIANLREGLRKDRFLNIENTTQQRSFRTLHGLNERECEIMLAGGLLNYTREQSRRV
jgi:aconitate hydratase